MKYFETSFKQAIPQVSQSNWSDLESWGRGGNIYLIDTKIIRTPFKMRFTSKVMPIMYSVLWWVLFLFDRLTTSPYWLWQPLCMCTALFWNWQCETHSFPSMWKWCPDLLLFKVFSRCYGNMPTWPMLILNLFESHKLFAPFLKLAAFEPDDAFLWQRFSAVVEIWFSTQTRGQIYISFSF